MAIIFNLQKALDELGDLSSNYIAVQTKTRPSSVLALTKGTMQRIDKDLLNSILNQLNIEAKKQNLNRKFTIEDIIEYVPDEENHQS